MALVASTDIALVRAEKAVAAFLRGFRDPNADVATYTGTVDVICTRSGDLNGLAMHEGRSTQQKSTPYLVISGESSKPISESQQATDIHEAMIELVLMTNRQEDEDSVTLPEVVHDKRAFAIDSLVYDEAALKEGINKPWVGADARAVDEFTMQASWIEDHQGAVEAGMITQTWVIGMICMPWDALVS